MKDFHALFGGLWSEALVLIKLMDNHEYHPTPLLNSSNERTIVQS
jgi:hypothetical protein